MPTTFQPSPQQAVYFDWILNGVGSAVLEAVAGSGKTTTLVEGLKLMKGTIFFGAYNKDIALELQSRAPQRMGLNISTMHAAGLKAWKRFAPKANVESNKVRNIFRAAAMRNPTYTPFESVVLELVSYAKQAAFGVTHNMNATSEWQNLVTHFGVDCLGEDELIIKLARMTLKESIKLNAVDIDFDDMIYAPLIGCNPDAPVQCDFYKNDWVLLDEAQDTNESRRLLSLAMLKKNGRLVAVGDRNQAIYGFTGADANALDLIAEAVNAKLLPLTVSFRCPTSVIAEAQRYVSHIQAAPTAPKGLVATVQMKDLIQTAKVGDVILSRFNAPNIQIAYTLIGAGIPARILGREIGAGLEKLTKRLKAKSFDDFYTKLTEFEEREVAKLKLKEKERAAEALTDQCNCLRVIADRALNTKNTLTVTESVIAEIKAIFTEDTKTPAVTLSSIHKAKGKEWLRVFWLQTGPSKMARLEWEHVQENNLMYVAATRAKETLYMLEQA